MLNSFIKKIIHSWVDGVLLIFSVGLLITSSDNFITNCLESKSSLRIFASFIFILVALSYIILYWRKLSYKFEGENENKMTNNLVFSQKWFSEDLPAIIAIIVIYTPVVVLLVIAFTNDSLTEVSVISDPHFEPIGNWAGLVLGTAFLSQAIEEIVNIKSKILKQRIVLANNVLFFIGFILYMIYAIHFTEISQ